MTPLYTYYAADLADGRVMGDLPLTDVSFGRVLNGPGELRATLPVSDRRVLAMNPRRLTAPGRTAVFVDRGGRLVWGGIVWTTRYSAAGAELEIGAADFLTYFEHRFVLPAEPPAGAPVARWPAVRIPEEGTADQLDVAEALVALAVRSGPAPRVGVRRAARASGTERSVEYRATDLKPVAEAIDDMASAEGGFDYTCAVSWDGGVPRADVLLGAPRLGQTGGAHLWEYGGGLVDFTWPVDGAGMATRVFAQGAGSGEEQLVAVAPEDASPPQGDLLLEGAVSAIDVDDESLLSSMAAERRRNASKPVVLPELTVRADMPPLLGSYEVGDRARIVIDDPFLGPAMNFTGRITEFKVTPGTDAEEETVQLTVAPDGGSAPLSQAPPSEALPSEAPPPEALPPEAPRSQAPLSDAQLSEAPEPGAPAPRSAGGRA